MDQRATKGVASRFAEYVEHLSEVIGHMDRHGPLASYCTGLLLPGERKSVEPMAARIAPDEVGAKHQSLHHSWRRHHGTKPSCFLPCARSCCRRSRKTHQSAPGLSTTRAFRRRASIRSAWRANTAA